jgi:hypothetical protein
MARKLVKDYVVVSLPEDVTAISKSAMTTLLRTAGDLELRIRINSVYGTILIPVTSAKQIMTGVTQRGNELTAAVNLFRNAYGNSDIAAIQTAQDATYGFSATYRISADAIGLDADYNDRVYIAIYNPDTGKFSRKNVKVNSAGQIAFASSKSGILLFSTQQFQN